MPGSAPYCHGVQTIGRHDYWSKNSLSSFWLLILLWRGFSHTGPSSPLISALCVHCCESEFLQVLLHHVEPSLLLTPSTPVSVYFSFHNFLYAVAISFRCTCL